MQKNGGQLAAGQRPAGQQSRTTKSLSWGGSQVKREEILAQLASGQLTVEEASKLLAELEQPKRGSLYCKVSEKGALSVYGLQRMPVTLYMEQWQRLLDFAEEVRQFIKDHDGELKRKAK
jgi:hypothetical protein